MINSLTFATLLALVHHTQQHPDDELAAANKVGLISQTCGQPDELWEHQSPWTLARPATGVAESPGQPRLVTATGSPPYYPVGILLPPASTAGQHALKVHVS